MSIKSNINNMTNAVARVKNHVKKEAPKRLDCSSCHYFENGECQKDKTGYHKDCYSPDVNFLKPAISELLEVKCTDTSSINRIAAAILIDLYGGISMDMLKVKYADVYGDVGHEQSGYARICWYVLAHRVSDSDNMLAFMKWFIDYQNGKKHNALKEAKDATKKRMAERYGNLTILFDEERFLVLEKDDYKAIVTPVEQGEDVCWGINTLRYKFIKEGLESFCDNHPKLYSCVTKEPRLFTVDEYKRYKDVLPEENKPFWLDGIVDGSTMFVMCGTPDKKILPMSTLSNNVTLRPIIEIDIRNLDI